MGNEKADIRVLKIEKESDGSGNKVPGGQNKFPLTIIFGARLRNT
jgi:hypothetical protein